MSRSGPGPRPGSGAGPAGQQRRAADAEARLLGYQDRIGQAFALQPGLDSKKAELAALEADLAATAKPSLAGLKQIDVYALDGDDAIDPMAAKSENLVRVSMNRVDTWRGVQRLEPQGWNEEAIAGALALPARAVPQAEAARVTAPADAGRDGERQHAERGAAAHDRQCPVEAACR